ncbi:MAG: class I SAM-dependent methyltransferase [Phycisphaerae bacterium]|nr:class I SAM-dependent methyltransferase [Phycisphaerae bacterium]
MTTSIPGPALAPDFERLYVEAGGDAARVPWARSIPDPALLEWLDRDAHAVLRAGCRACVVGCGLGDDARELSRRGFDVTAFDLSPTAVAWARRLDPEHEASYVEGDLFSPPSRWLRRFDLVVDAFCLQSMPPSRHRAALAALANLLSPRGALVIVGHDGDGPRGDAEGPPWPVRTSDLDLLAAASGLQPAAPTRGSLVGGRLRGVFVRD